MTSPLPSLGADVVRQRATGIVRVAQLQVQVGVGHDQVALGSDAADVELQPRVSAVHPCHEGDECLRAVLGNRIVPYDARAEVVVDQGHDAPLSA